MARIARLGLPVATLGALAVLVPAGVLAAATAGASRAGPPTCSSNEHDGTEAPARRVDAAHSTTGPSGSGQAVTVEVPPGALYLEPNRVVVRAPAHGGPVRLAPVLVADLREATPGWQLTAILAEVGGEAVELRIDADHPEPVVGERVGARRSGHTRLGVGTCAVLAEGTPGHGWGSYLVTPTVDVTGAGPTTGTDLELVLEYQVRTL